jgi:hypothetical protein
MRRIRRSIILPRRRHQPLQDLLDRRCTALYLPLRNTPAGLQSGAYDTPFESQGLESFSFRVSSVLRSGTCLSQHLRILVRIVWKDVSTAKVPSQTFKIS